MKKIIKKIKSFIFSPLVRLEAGKVGGKLKVNGYSRVTTQTKLGDNVNFNGMIIYGNGPVTIGNNFHSGKKCVIITNFHDYDHGNAIPYDSSRSIQKHVLIEDNVWIGYGVIILGGVTIGEGSIIQAGSVVVNDIPPYSIAGGHPAKKFKERDIKHYNDLKQQGSFI